MPPVRLTKRGKQSLRKLHGKDLARCKTFLADLEAKGPLMEEYNGFGRMNFGPYYKAHITLGLIAMWKISEAGEEIKVVYIGRREGAPYEKHYRGK